MLRSLDKSSRFEEKAFRSTCMESPQLLEQLLSRHLQNLNRNHTHKDTFLNHSLMLIFCCSFFIQDKKWERNKLLRVHGVSQVCSSCLCSPILQLDIGLKVLSALQLKARQIVAILCQVGQSIRSLSSCHHCPSFHQSSFRRMMGWQGSLLYWTCRCVHPYKHKPTQLAVQRPGLQGLIRQLFSKFSYQSTSTTSLWLQKGIEVG